MCKTLFNVFTKHTRFGDEEGIQNIPLPNLEFKATPAHGCSGVH
jgi:hypothetical protein